MIALKKVGNEVIFENLPDAVWQTRREQIVKLAENDGVTFNELMTAIFTMAKMLEDSGNRGVSVRELEEFLSKINASKAIMFLNLKYDVAWDGILFHADGKKKHDPKGWMVRKSPHWKLKWAERVGWDDPIAQEIVQEQHQTALRENEAYNKARKRPKTVIDHYELDAMSDMVLAHRILQVANLMPDLANATASVRFMWVMYSQIRMALSAEFVWRWLYHPDEKVRNKLSKFIDMHWYHHHSTDIHIFNTMHIVRTDWIAKHIYGTVEPVDTVWDERDESDLPVPTRLSEVERMSEKQVIMKFWRLLTDSDAEAMSIPPKDKTKIVERLRALLKNARADF